MRRTLLGIGLGSAGFLLAAELLFRLLPVSTTTSMGYGTDPLILSYPPHHHWTMATGWDLRNAQHLQSNGLGFASEHEFVPDANAVALVGDSYVEASMLQTADRPDRQLERALGGRRPVYAFGGPGSALLDYAERIRFAAQRLAVRDVVLIMEAGDVRQVLCDSGNVHAVCLDAATLDLRVQTLPPPSAAKRLLRHSALLQYINSQLKADPRKLAATLSARHAYSADASVAPASGAVGQDSLSAPQRRMVDTVADHFFARLDDAAPGVRLVVVALAGSSADHPVPSAMMFERARFIERLEERGVKVVDAETLFAAYHQHSARFLAVGPYDGHLNPLGVGLIAAAVAQRLAEQR